MWPVPGRMCERYPLWIWLLSSVAVMDEMTINDAALVLDISPRAVHQLVT